MKYCIVILACLFAGCSSNDPYKKLDKLSGLWQMNTDEGPLYEEWSKSHNNIMYGKSYMVNGADSMVFERVQLIKSDSGIYYVPTVKDQNQNKPVYFKLISSENSVFTFENKRHDFPKRIIYQFVNNDSLNARLEGDENNGQQAVQPFYYSRVKR